MDDKRNSLLTIGLVCAVLLVLGVADLWNSDRVYSEAENRVLASRPAFSWESLFTGEYGDAYEKYMSDQFVGRDKWVGLKTRADIRFRKKEINGVYLGADHYLIGVNDPGEYTEQMENSRVASLTKLVNHWDAKVMLVPTADNILTDKLPAFAPYYDEERLLMKVQDSIGEDHYIDVYHALQEHAQEPIYYRTDHHWTSLGAYYGFLAWADSVGRFPYPYDVNGMKTVSENFQGTLHPTNVMQKAQFIIEHFMKNVSKMLGGQAKAMIVASSRPAVIRYKYAIEAYLHAHPEYDREQVAEAIRFQVPGEPLVAFSGKVNGATAIMDEDESTITEFDYLKENPFAAIRRDYDYTEENSNNIAKNVQI